MGRAAVAELVVVDHRPAGGGETLEGIDIVMGAARTAVEDDDGGAWRRGDRR
jgi:hypothetical protein